jgi:glycosyltransferase involved in cell wall biosynthesis
MRILFTAYGYDKGDISESLTAYMLSKEVAKFCKIMVLTRSKVPYPNTVNLKCTPLLSRTAYYNAFKLDYFEFIIKAYVLAKNCIDSLDIIQHISPISFRYPNLLCSLNKPFIWGPIGGSIPYPKGFSVIEKRDPLSYKLRRIDSFRLRFDPFLISTMKNARRIVVTSKAALENMPEKYRKKTIAIPEGIEFDMTDLHLWEGHAGNHIFSSGRLAPYKAIDLLIKAFALSKGSNNTRLLITGDGPEKTRLTKLVGELGLHNKIKLLGKVSHNENMKLMKTSMFCVFPAINEAFGHVNLEAMAMRKAIIVTDHGGPADIVVHGVSGFKIKAANVDDYVKLLVKKMNMLLQNETLRKIMGDNAFKRVNDNFSWKVIGNRYKELYEDVLREN